MTANRLGVAVVLLVLGCGASGCVGAPYHGERASELQFQRKVDYYRKAIGKEPKYERTGGFGGGGGGFSLLQLGLGMLMRWG